MSKEKLKPNRHRNQKLSNRVVKEIPTVEEMLESAKLADKKKKPLYLNDKNKTIVITSKKNHTDKFRENYLNNVMKVIRC